MDENQRQEILQYHRDYNKEYYKLNRQRILEHKKVKKMIAKRKQREYE